jgi:protein SCO1/2
MRFTMAISPNYTGLRGALLLTLLLSLQVNAQNYTDNLQQRIGIDQKLGNQLPLDLPFLDSDGNLVHLGDYFGDKPLILSLVYFDCPMLCTQVINSLLRAMNVLSFGAGTEFDVLTISIDPDETPELANAKKIEYLKNYRGREGSTGWHFLTGDQEQIQQLATAVGFRYEYDEPTDQYIHASGIMILTPEGKLARYFYGIDYPPRDLRWGLVEAADGAIGNPVDQLLLLCYSYDPMTGKYGLYIRNSLRIGGLATILAIGSFIVVMLRRERRGELQQPKPTSSES